MIIELDWPPKELTPNFKRRNHWSAYREQTKQYRADCFWLTEKAADRSFDAEGRIAITVDFYPPDKRHRDDDNMISSFKAGRDGIADALQVNDRRFLPLYRFHDPVKGGKVVVTI